jgi:hypothetical protein
MRIPLKSISFIIVSLISLPIVGNAAASPAYMTPIIQYLLDSDTGSSSSNNSSEGSSSSSGSNSDDPKYTYEYEGMTLYKMNMPNNAYHLHSLSDSEFYTLTLPQKRVVADKLLATLYFGVPKEAFETMIASSTFMSDIETMITQERNDLSVAEARLNDNGDDDEEFSFSTWPNGTEETSKILARFYVLEYLDKHYIDFWSSYVLTSTIMFSPAYELESSHAPNIARVYGALVRNQRDDCSIAYLTFLHMISDDNWRRFRSPEDNGREMMEIFLQDFNDAHVPIAAQALKNWNLDRDYDTLVIGLDDNTQPLSLFGTTITDGYDFYRELAKSDAFVPAVTSRLVDIYFPTFSNTQKATIVSQIIESDPGTWQDILLQIVFSKEYLFNSDKPKSAEELFYSQSKKSYFQHRRGFFSRFAKALTNMHQAPMKYKLGKYTEVPLDTQSFLTYHKAIREGIMIRYYGNGWSSGWSDELVRDEVFNGIFSNNNATVIERFVDYLFLTTLSRTATQEEKNFFKSHMLYENGTYKYEFELFPTANGDDPLNDRRNTTVTIMDYLSRLAEFYRFQKVQ